MRIYQLIAQRLLDCGHDFMFGVMGDANMQYVAEYVERGGRFIYAVNESGATSMAHGYALMRREPTVVTVTNGPGVTNAITALTECARANSPVVLLTGQTVSERGKLQTLDVAAVAHLAGVEYRRVLHPGHVADDLARAISHARMTSGPVLLDIANDFLGEQVDYQPTQLPAPPAREVAPGPGALDAALGVLASSRRPIVLAGRGAVLSGAAPELRGLAELIDAPLATTLRAKDCFRGDPYNLDIAGTLSHGVTVGTFADADCVIAFGASLNRYTTAEGSLLADKAVIQCDVDPAAIGRNATITCGVVGDAKAAASAMHDQLRDLQPRPWRFRTEELRRALARRVPAEEYADQTGAETIDMRTAAIRLDEIIPPDRALITDCGRFISAPWRFMHVADAAMFAHTVAFGAVGLALAAGVGAALADTTRPTVAVLGDGGAMMGMMELTTAVRHALPLLVVILNDGAYGAEYTKLSGFGLDPEHSLCEWPDLAEVAVALGARAVTATKLADLDRARELIDEKTGPVVLDVRCDVTVDADQMR